MTTFDIKHLFASFAPEWNAVAPDAQIQLTYNVAYSESRKAFGVAIYAAADNASFFAGLMVNAHTVKKLLSTPYAKYTIAMLQATEGSSPSLDKVQRDQLKEIAYAAVHALKEDLLAAEQFLPVTAATKSVVFD